MGLSVLSFVFLRVWEEPLTSRLAKVENKKTECSPLLWVHAGLTRDPLKVCNSHSPRL